MVLGFFVAFVLFLLIFLFFLFFLFDFFLLAVFVFASATLLRYDDLQFSSQGFFYLRNLLRLILNPNLVIPSSCLILLPFFQRELVRGKIALPLRQPQVNLVLFIVGLFRHCRFPLNSGWLERGERDLLH